MSRIITSSISRTLPGTSDANRAYWTGGSKLQLLILRNKKTREWAHPPEVVDFAAGDYAAEPVSGKGTVFTFSVNHHQYNPKVPVPYVLAMVELPEQEGLRVVCNIVNCDVNDVYIGMPVQVLFEQQDDLFVPLFEPDTETRESTPHNKKVS
jgi:uncharacterized protein